MPKKSPLGTDGSTCSRAGPIRGEPGKGKKSRASGSRTQGALLQSTLPSICTPVEGFGSRDTPLGE